MSRFRSAIATVLASGTLVALSLGAPAAGRADPPRTPEAQAAALITPAVVYMDMNFTARVVEANNGAPFTVTTRCTGFALSSDGYIGTAGHCVDPAEQRDEVIKSVAKEMDGQGGKTADQWAQFGATNWTYQVQQNGAASDREVLVLGAGQPKDAKPLPARVVDFRPLGEGDAGLLKVELGNKSIPVAELAPTQPQVGDPILAVGYPASTDKVTDFTLVPAVKSGTISALQTWKTQPLLQISAPTSAGMSGGPTVDLQGRVVGIVSFKPTEEQEAFNFISPVQALNEMIKGHGVEAKLGPADTAYRNGLNDLNNGKYTEAIDNMNTALALSPDYPGARDLQRQAVQLRSQAGDTPAASSGPKPWMFVAAFVVIVALIGGGVLVFALSRRNKEPAMAGGGSWPGPAAQPAPAAPPRPPNVGMGAPAGGPSPAGGVPPPPSGGEIHCNNCGYSLAPGAGFCPRCGKPQG